MGKSSVKETPVNGIKLLEGLVMVNFRVDVAPTATLSGVKTFTMLGGTTIYTFTLFGAELTSVPALALSFAKAVALLST